MMHMPWMSQTEIAMIKSYLKPQHIMLEWGSGGSTHYFPTFVEKYYSIEHDLTWFHKMAAGIPHNVVYNLVLPDQMITDPTQKHQVQTYIDFVDTLNISKFDAVLIDGRGRGWCAEKVVKYLHEDSVVFIHDYWQRPQYHIVETWYNVVDHVKDGQSLVVLKPKKEYIAI